ncbi:MAG TPA: FAD-binding and (Fe-S)-binding domain-containing protein [Nocardioides sp.]|uniref:FAD-binding and (Fe-S)-binding domain-containing protein n=1 Tax=Nocardioides sp. TaxID=35761 RepID=UPI002F40B426
MTVLEQTEAGSEEILEELNAAVEGEVRFDDASRHLYANDASIYRVVPLGIVIPRDARDVVRALEVCRRHRLPVLARGGGTGLAGQTVNAAVVFDFSKYMNEIVELDTESRTATVQPGVICDQLRHAAMEHGLTFAPDPATHDHNTLGGMIGNNSCGTHSVYGGKTVDNVLELDVVLYDGTRMTLGIGDEDRLDELVSQGGRVGDIYRRLREIRDTYGDLVRERFPDIPRRVSGYNLDDLLPEKGFNTARALVGTEGTCLLVLQAKVRLLPWPPKRSLVVLGYPDTPTAAEDVTDILESEPVGLEFFESGILENLKLKGFESPGMNELPSGNTFVLIEYGGDTDEEVAKAAEGMAKRLRKGSHPPDIKTYEDPGHETDIWEIRRGAIGSTRIPQEHGGMAGWEDAAVDPSRLSAYLSEFCELVERYGYHTVLFGHFGQGCTHCRLDLDISTAEGIDTFHRFLREAGDLVISHGGVPSGEHGDGQLRAELLGRVYGEELVRAFEEFKAIFDPDGLMNPGKVVHPNSPVDDLRLGVDYSPPRLRTQFSFAEDGFSFADAANRCFGVGKCRHLDGGTMCPSFMVTREEKHSTRGRARLLFEMMQTAGERRNAWRDEGVKDALDLCLACKGCKGDCPVRVDMATYKAEFLSHYYRGRLRPRSAYALGLIQRWAALAAHAPGVVNRLAHWPLTRNLLKAAAGVAQERDLPRFADRTFRDSATGRQPAHPEGPPVMLWTDTFTNHFQPEVAAAAVRVLEAAGCQVRLGPGSLCCGRPLYDYGMVRTAKRYLRRILDRMRDDIRAGTPVVVLEPSCAAVFADELLNLMPHDEDAKRLASQTFTLAGYLAEHRPDWDPPTLGGTALVQVHCHQGAEFGYDAEQQLLERLGLSLDLPDSGCCGMAGSFGYEAGEKYDVSQACGERVILPAVRDASPSTLVIADGFSCREQIGQATDRTALHLAQVLDLALSHAAADGGTDTGPARSGEEEKKR